MSSTSYRYSHSKKDIGEAKNFSWEYPIPDNDFWNPLDFVVGRNFLHCFSADEISQMPFDSTLSKADTLKLLLKLLQDKLLSEDTAAAPKTLYDVNYLAWDKLLLARHTIQLHLGRLDDAEQTLRELIDRRKDETNLSHLHSLSVMLENSGDYVGAEETERPVRIWLDEKLGKDSPQALGSRRIIARNMWRQGPSKRAEAREWMSEVMALIDASDGGRFAVYQDEQRSTTEKMIATLDGWDGA